MSQINFTNIQVVPLTMELDRYYRPQHKWCHWCGSVADYNVTRTSLLSPASTWTDPACAKCAEGWREAAVTPTE